MKVIIELRPSSAILSASVGLDTGVGYGGSDLPGFIHDVAYPPVQLPAVRTVGGALLHSLSQPLSFSFDAQASTYLIRGSIPAGAGQATALAAAAAHPDVVAVFSDPLIQPAIVCPGDPPVGTARTVGTRLARTALHAAELDGRGVYLPIVDTGTTVAYLKRMRR